MTDLTPPPTAPEGGSQTSRFYFLNEPSAPPPPPPNHTVRNALIAITTIAVVAVIGIVAYVLLIGSGTKSSNKRNTPADTQTATLRGTGADRLNRVYHPSVSAVYNKDVYTLADATDNVLKQVKDTKNWRVATPLGQKAYLLYDTSNGAPQYAVLRPSGLSRITEPPATLATAKTAGEPSAIRALTDFSDTLVAYQYCRPAAQLQPDDDTYQCSLRQYDLAANKEAVVPTPATLKEYQATLAGFSADRTRAYYTGLAPADRESLQQRVNRLATNPTADQAAGINTVEDLQYPLSVLTLDLSTQKVSRVQTVDVYNTSWPLWLSPNGEHVVYQRSQQPGVLYVTNVASGSKTRIDIPSTQSDPAEETEWTIRSRPQFSPSGAYMAYSAVDDVGLKESFGLIDLTASTARELLREPADNQYAGASYFDNMLWQNNTTLLATAGADNVHITPASPTPKLLSDKYGMLVGYPAAD